MGDKVNIGPIVKVTKSDDEWKKLLSPRGLSGLAA